jgi:low molecular weight protein-tyrosine phosphatase
VNSEAPARVLFVCTANICRSPMAAALLADQLARRGVPATITSAGLLESGRVVADGTVRVLGARGLDVRAHVSQQLAPDLVEASDLVLGMEHRHLQEAALMAGGGWGRVFTLREIVRRGEAAGARWPGETLTAWIGRVSSGRTPKDLVGAWGDDIDDPYGQHDDAYRATLAEIDDLVSRLVELAWPMSDRR